MLPEFLTDETYKAQSDVAKAYQIKEWLYGLAIYPNVDDIITICDSLTDKNYAQNLIIDWLKKTGNKKDAIQVIKIIQYFKDDYVKTTVAISWLENPENAKDAESIKLIIDCLDENYNKQTIIELWLTNLENNPNVESIKLIIDSFESNTSKENIVTIWWEKSGNNLDIEAIKKIINFIDDDAYKIKIITSWLAQPMNHLAFEAIETITQSFNNDASKRILINTWLENPLNNINSEEIAKIIDLFENDYDKKEIIDLWMTTTKINIDAPGIRKIIDSFKLNFFKKEIIEKWFARPGKNSTAKEIMEVINAFADDDKKDYIITWLGNPANECNGTSVKTIIDSFESTTYKKEILIAWLENAENNPDIAIIFQLIDNQDIQFRNEIIELWLNQPDEQKEKQERLQQYKSYIEINKGPLDKLLLDLQLALESQDIDLINGDIKNRTDDYFAMVTASNNSDGLPDEVKSILEGNDIKKLYLLRLLVKFNEKPIDINTLDKFSRKREMLNITIVSLFNKKSKSQDIKHYDMSFKAKISTPHPQTVMGKPPEKQDKLYAPFKSGFLKPMETHYWNADPAQKTAWLLSSEKKPFKVTQKDGILYRGNTKLEPGDYLYVISPKGGLYVIEESSQSRRQFILEKLKGTDPARYNIIYHSSIRAGQPVVCAGEIKIDKDPKTVQSKITYISNNSGHYKPSKENLLQSILWLHENKIIDKERDKDCLIIGMGMSVEQLLTDNEHAKVRQDYAELRVEHESKKSNMSISN